MVNLTHVPGLHNQRRARSQVFVDESVMHGRRQEQTRNGRQLGRRIAIRENDDVGPAADLVDHLIAQGVDGAREPFGTLTDSVGLEETVDDHGRESFHSLELFDVADLGQFVDTQYRRRQDDLVAVVRALGEQVVLATDRDPSRRDEFFTDCVERRIRDLGEELREEIKERSREL